MRGLRPYFKKVRPQKDSLLVAEISSHLRQRRHGSDFGHAYYKRRPGPKLRVKGSIKAARFTPPPTGSAMSRT